MKRWVSTLAMQEGLGQIIKDQSNTGWSRDRTSMLRTGGIIIERQNVIGAVKKDTLPGIAPYRKEGGIRSATHVVRKGIFHGTVQYGRNGEIKRIKGGEKEGPDKKIEGKSQKAMGEEEEPRLS